MKRVINELSLQAKFMPHKSALLKEKDNEKRGLAPTDSVGAFEEDIDYLGCLVCFEISLFLKY